MEGVIVVAVQGLKRRPRKELWRRIGLRVAQLAGCPVNWEVLAYLICRRYSGPPTLQRYSVIEEYDMYLAKHHGSSLLYGRLIRRYPHLGTHLFLHGAPVPLSIVLGRSAHILSDWLGSRLSVADRLSAGDHQYHFSAGDHLSAGDKLVCVIQAIGPGKGLEIYVMGAVHADAHIHVLAPTSRYRESQLLLLHGDGGGSSVSVRALTYFVDQDLDRLQSLARTHHYCLKHLRTRMKIAAPTCSVYKAIEDRQWQLGLSRDWWEKAPVPIIRHRFVSLVNRTNGPYELRTVYDVVWRRLPGEVTYVYALWFSIWTSMVNLALCFLAALIWLVYTRTGHEAKLMLWVSALTAMFHTVYVFGCLALGGISYVCACMPSNPVVSGLVYWLPTAVLSIGLLACMAGASVIVDTGVVAAQVTCACYVVFLALATLYYIKSRDLFLHVI